MLLYIHIVFNLIHFSSCDHNTISTLSLKHTPSCIDIALQQMVAQLFKTFYAWYLDNRMLMSRYFAAAVSQK